MSDFGRDSHFEASRPPINTAFVVFDIGKNVHAMAVYSGYELQVRVKPAGCTPVGPARQLARRAIVR